VAQKFKIALFVELLILGCYFFSFSLFINVQLATLNSFLIIVATNYTHKKILHSRLESGLYTEQKDPLDTIEDPHELWDDEINEAPIEELDIKQIIKEERGKQKILSASTLKQGLQGSFSLLRIGGYVFLILSFIALKNNNVLVILYYLPSLALGILLGGIVSKPKEKGGL